MLYILTIYLILFATFSYYYSNRDILSPTFLLSVLFIVSNIFAIVGNIQWKVTINPKLIIVFFIGMFGLFIGELMIIGNKKSSQLNVKTNEVQNDRIDISFGKMLVIVIMSILILLLYIRRLVEIATTVGYSGSMLVQYVRWADIMYGIRLGNLYTILLGLISSSAFLCIYIICYNTLIAKTKLISTRNLIYFIPIIINIIKTIFSGARSGLILTLFVMFGCSLILYQDNIKKIKMGKFIVIGSISLFGFLILFTNLGKLKSNITSSNFIENILIYVGSSIVGLSTWLDKGLVGSNGIFAGESFWGLRYALNKLFPLVQVQTKFLEFTYFPGGSSTNIYTAFRSFMYDFGWIGLFLIMLLIGIMINTAYVFVLKNKNPLSLLIYVYFLYSFIYILFTPSITSNLFTSTQIFDVIWMIVIYYYYFKLKIKF